MNNTNEYIISIIIPTYKPQDYIIECFMSIEAQSFSKIFFEVIVILNGDFDPYYSYIDDYLSRCTFLYKICYTEIKGVSNARNIGIEQSKGEYLAFIDDDDIISENYLQKLYDIAKNNLIPLSYAKAFKGAIINEENFFLNKIYNKYYTRKITVFNVRSFFSIPYCKLLSREILGSYRFDQNFQNGEDSLFMFAISRRNMKLQFTNRTAVYYRRIRDNSLTTRKISASYKIKNTFRLILAVTRIYFESPSKYSFLLYFFRILAYFKILVKSYD